MRCLLALLLASTAYAQDDPALRKLLDSVQARYNSVTTLQVTFDETYTAAGRGRKIEAGELYLRKPGRMRWVYNQPSGKLFVSDGKSLFYFNPQTNRAEKLKVKESEDLRAPLAFLLGRLDFDKDFQNFSSATTENGAVVTAEPKSDKLPYRSVQFTVGPLNEIRRLQITGQDNSLIIFTFTNERMNPTLDPALFRFELPASASWVDSSSSGQQQ